MSPEAIAKIEFLKLLTFCSRCGVRLQTKKAKAEKRCTNRAMCSRRQHGKPCVKISASEIEKLYEAAPKLGDLEVAA